MSIKIDSNLEYLKSKLNIPDSRLEEYQGKSVEEILLSEAAQGNQMAIQVAADMFTDPEQLVELFQLADPENKLIIIRSMPSYDMKELIPMLDIEDLIVGLQFFSQEKLLDLLKEVPKEELVKVVFEMFSPEQIITYMPEEQLDKLLTGVNMDKNLVIKNLQSLPAMYLQQIIESVTGEEANGTSQSLAFQISQFSDSDYKAAIRNLRPVQKQELTLAITTQHPKLYEQFDASAYTNIMNRERNKEEIIKSMEVIKPEYLHKMIAQLPDDLMSIVLTQIDDQKFADVLINKHPEILAKFLAG
ncbi:hypothetical protein IJ579_01575 [bacterium]|nr:hypothetical protein [bacterium]